MVSVTNPLMDSEIWGANLAGKCVACRSNKAFTPHPTMAGTFCLMQRWRVLSGYVELNLPAPGGSHPHELQMQKSLLVEQAFRIWSVIEDSNLRPLRPERSALPGCANHRMRGASYCADTPSSIP